MCVPPPAPPHIRRSDIWRPYICLGLAGFALDWLLLEVLTGFGWHPLLARLVSILPAALLFTLNARFTFKGVATAKPVPYPALALAGMILNYAVFVRVLNIPLPPAEMPARFCALAAGTLVALLAQGALLRQLVLANPLEDSRFIKYACLALAALFFSFDSPALVFHLHSVMSYPKMPLPLNPPDSDAWLRLTQVRQWMAGGTEGMGGFYDHHVAHTNAPFGGISTPWTRPMDMLLAALAWLMSASQSPTQRVMAAAAWLPAMLGLGVFAFAAAAARRHFRHYDVAVLVGLLLALANLDEFSPGGADHHGLLCLLWAGVIWALLAARAVVAGILCGLMIWVSPEGLIITAFSLGIFGLEALALPEKTRRLPLFLGAALLTAAAALCVEMPMADITARPAYDTLSIVQLTLLALATVAALVLVPLFKHLRRVAARGMAAALAGIVVLGAMWKFYPLFFKGPLAEVDPFIITGFLPRVSEAKTLWQNPLAITLDMLLWPLLASVLFFVALRHSRRRTTKRFCLITAAALTFSFVLCLAEVRWNYYLQPAAIIVIAALLPAVARGAKDNTFGWLRGAPRMIRSFALPCLLALALFYAQKLVPAPTKAQDFCLTQLRYAVQTQQLQKILGDTSLTVLVPQDMAGEIQFFTPYRVIAGNYHREGIGLRDLAAIEAAPGLAVAKPLLERRKVDAVFTCPALYAENSWLNSLQGEVTEIDYLKLGGAKPVLRRLNP